MKRILFPVAALVCLMAPAAVTVTVDRAQQRFPWNGLVDVDFTLSGTTDGTGYRPELTLDSGDRTYVASTFLSEPFVLGDGAHRLTWDFGRDFPETALTNMTVTVGVAPFADTDPLYLVFDISEGPAATSYPHRYTTTAPDLSSDVCRTTEVWLKRIPAGQFTMGYSHSNPYTANKSYLPSHQVKLTKPYYLGIFEVTQKQYNLLTDTWPSYFTAERETRPVETVSYSTLRGADGTGNWYQNPPVHSRGSFFYAVAPKFGFSRLDFPTEAQWEHACRAGTVAYTYDVSVQARTLGRCKDEKPADGVDASTLPAVGGTAKVGSFRPNAWGLYDMMGNVQEFVGDGNPYSSNSLVPADGDFASELYVDPRGPTAECVARRSDITETYVGAIVVRDGPWTGTATSMLVYQRTPYGRSDSNKFNTLGFRLCITCD